MYISELAKYATPPLRFAFGEASLRLRNQMSHFYLFWLPSFCSYRWKGDRETENKGKEETAASAKKGTSQVDIINGEFLEEANVFLKYAEENQNY